MDVQVIKRDQLPAHELVGRDHGGVGVCVIFVDAPSGGGPSRHRHPYEEVFITLEGEATFVVNDEEIVAKRDDIVIVPPATPRRSRRAAITGAHGEDGGPHPNAVVARKASM